MFFICKNLQDHKRGQVRWADPVHGGGAHDLRRNGSFSYIRESHAFFRKILTGTNSQKFYEKPNCLK